jgi:hypothetical protein
MGRPKNFRLRHARRESRQESLGATLSNRHCGIQIRMVAGSADVIERRKVWLQGSATIRIV